jgi:hypothetical protein
MISPSLPSLLDGQTDWLDYVPAYQREAMNSLVNVHGDLEAAAQAWLEASPTNTAGFGGVSGGKIFYGKVRDALHRLICGGDDTAAARAEIAKELQTAKHAGVASLVTIVSDQVGASPTLLTPAIAVVLTVIGQVGLRAWCETVTELREQEKLQAG